MYSEKPRDHNDHDDNADNVKNIHAFAPLKHTTRAKKERATCATAGPRLMPSRTSKRWRALTGSGSRLCLCSTAGLQRRSHRATRSPITSAATPVSAAPEQQHNHDDNQN
jgi:hypothetical protein